MNTCQKRQKILNETASRMDSFFTPNQVLGRLHSIGCVAVEITQKCNLDCTLCYLSESSQHVKDIPLVEVYRRLDKAVLHYGEGTHVQITGGDPTLRKHSELVEIVRYARNIGLYPALFTNGIAASRELLEKLARVGLCDIAFHVDTTQRREEGSTEEALHSIRKAYIERTRGLGLHVMFNTTIHKGNFHELPSLVQFFRRNADNVGLASFQLQAETGRGEWRSRDLIISQHTVRQQIESGAGTVLPWDAIQVGHHDCHSYLPTVVVNGNVYPLALDKHFFSQFLQDFSVFKWDRLSSRWHIFRGFVSVFMRNPSWWRKGIRYLGHQLKSIGPDFIKSGGRVHKLTFFIQNFMDATELDEERIGACSFMVMTANGPVSMCEHNAKRDDHILQPLEFKNADGDTEIYQPIKEILR